MTYEDFANIVIQFKLIPRRCGANHWQIRGGLFLVNFYPVTNKGPSFYVNGMHRGRREQGKANDALLAAIVAAQKLPARRGENAERWTGNSSGRRKHRNLKQSLFGRDQRCHLCGETMTLERGHANTATLDHLIPISKGGSNSHDNQRLACDHCNRNRKNKQPTKMPHRRARVSENTPDDGARPSPRCRADGQAQEA